MPRPDAPPLPMRGPRAIPSRPWWMRRSLAKKTSDHRPWTSACGLTLPGSSFSWQLLSLFHQPKIRFPRCCCFPRSLTFSLAPSFLPSLNSPPPHLRQPKHCPSTRCSSNLHPANRPSESPMPCFEIGTSRTPPCPSSHVICARRVQTLPLYLKDRLLTAHPQTEQPEARWETARRLQGKLPPHPAALAFSRRAARPLAR